MAKALRITLLVLLLVSFICSFESNGQGVAVNASGAPPDASAILDVSSSSQGFALPRLTQGQRDLISNPVLGLQIYNTTTNCLNFWTGSSWRQVCGECGFSPPVAASNGPVCAGEDAQLTATYIEGASYNWTGPGGYTSSIRNPTIQAIQESQAGEYLVSATLGGCTSSASATVLTVLPLPDASFSPLTGVEDAPVQFTANHAPGSYQWSFTGGNPISSADYSPSVTWNAPGLYDVTLSVTANGCTTTETLPVNISSPTILTFSTPGSTSWVAPQGVTSATVIVIGGGGGGGAGGGGTSGGGGGGYARSIVSVVPGQSYPIVVGAGGLESTSGSWWLAQSGGASSFNGSIIANGGTGGNNSPDRKPGGTASGGNILNLTGGYGGAGNEPGESGPTGGGGGWSDQNGGIANQPYGGNGGNGVSNNNIGGGNGALFGGGGGGGHSRPTGNPNERCRGGDGAVILIF